MIKHIFQLTFLSAELRQPVQFGIISERFKNIELIPLSDTKCELIVTKEDNKPLTNSLEEATLEANELIDRLSMLDNHQITSLIYIRHSDEKSIIAHSSGSSSAIAKNSTVIIDNPLWLYQLEENSKVFLGTKNITALRIYRFSQSIQDDISKYLIYYGLLQILISEEQKELEKYIKIKIPQIPMEKRLKSFRNGKVEEVNETILTSIRNMIAHPNDSLDMKDLNKKVSEYLETIRRLVLSILKN